MQFAMRYVVKMMSQFQKSQISLNQIVVASNHATSSSIVSAYLDLPVRGSCAYQALAPEGVWICSILIWVRWEYKFLINFQRRNIFRFPTFCVEKLSASSCLPSGSWDLWSDVDIASITHETLSMLGTFDYSPSQYDSYSLNRLMSLFSKSEVVASKFSSQVFFYMTVEEDPKH